MDSLPTSIPTRDAFSRAVRPLPGGDPSAFLRLFREGPRGMWGQGDRWVAWAGAAAVLQVSGGEDSGSRFRELRDRARRLVGGSPHDWRRRSAAERPRFFGGFAFLDEDPVDPAWSGFPRARFVLPRFTLERNAEGIVLAGWGRDGIEGDPGTGLDRIVESLAGGGGQGVDLRAPGGGVEGTSPAPAPGPNGRPDPGDRVRWDEAVVRILGAIGKGKVEKAVLARVRDAAFSAPVDTVAALSYLRRENVHAHVFLVEAQPGRVLLGAAPELLARVRAGVFHATAVAGSIPRGTTPDGDRTLAAELLASAKDRSEHDLTVREIWESLSGRLDSMEVDPEPGVLTLARIQHLETRIRGSAREGEDVLSLLEALHPTPAICGRPRKAALELIRGAEPFDRGWYAGPVGWFDPAGDGEFVPALRSAVGGGRVWRLYAGAGIVAGSNPEAEWAETALKFEPALRALRAGAGTPE